MSEVKDLKIIVADNCYDFGQKVNKNLLEIKIYIYYQMYLIMIFPIITMEDVIICHQMSIFKT